MFKKSALSFDALHHPLLQNHENCQTLSSPRYHRWWNQDSVTCPKVKKRGREGERFFPLLLWKMAAALAVSTRSPVHYLPHTASHRSYGVRARRSKILVVENLDGAGVEVSNFWRQGDQIFLEKSAVTKKNSYVH